MFFTIFGHLLINIHLFAHTTYSHFSIKTICYNKNITEKTPQPDETQTIPSYFRPETTITNKSADTSSAYSTQETRRLIFIFIAIELFLVLPTFITAFYIFNPSSQPINGPSATTLTTTLAFLGTLFFTIINAPFSIVFSRIIRKRTKHLTFTQDKNILALRICFTIISSIPAILLVIVFLHMIIND